MGSDVIKLHLPLATTTWDIYHPEASPVGVATDDDIGATSGLTVPGGGVVNPQDSTSASATVVAYVLADVDVNSDDMTPLFFTASASPTPPVTSTIFSHQSSCTSSSYSLAFHSPVQETFGTGHSEQSGTEADALSHVGKTESSVYASTVSNVSRDLGVIGESVEEEVAGEVGFTSTSVSLAPTPGSVEDRPITRTTKHTHLKRVSFGSSKGSMVETLVYDSPVSEEPPNKGSGWSRSGSRARPSASAATGTSSLRGNTALITSTPLPEDEAATRLAHETGVSRPLSRVRVTFYESERPLTLSSPEPSEQSADDSDYTPLSTHLVSPTILMAQETTPSAYDRQISAESGQDNPFRPDGDLSREADEIVEAIKEGRPISDALRPKSGAVTPTEEEEKNVEEHVVDRSTVVPDHSSPLSSPTKSVGGANGNATPTISPSSPVKAPPSPGAVEVQHGIVVPASDGGQVEHVVIKKKGKCQCCVVM